MGSLPKQKPGDKRGHDLFMILLRRLDRRRAQRFRQPKLNLCA